MPLPPAPPPSEPVEGNNRLKCVVSVSPYLLLINSAEEEKEDMQHFGSSPRTTTTQIGVVGAAPSSCQ